MKMLEFFRPKRIETQENGASTRKISLENPKSVILETAKDKVTFLEKNHTLALDRLVKLVGEDKVGELLNILKQDERTQREICQQVREILIRSIHEQKLQSPNEVVPWEGKNRYREYMIAIRFLEDTKTRDTLYALKTEEAKKLVNTIRQTFEENEIFRKLYGRKNGINQRTGEPHISPFFRAFEKKDSSINNQNNQAKSFSLKREANRKEIA